MKFFDKIKGLRNRSPTQTRFQLMNDRGNGFYSWNGKLYQSDIVRACIRPKVKAVGKLVAKHIRTSVTPSGETKIQVNPDAYMRFLLEEPNPFMTGQMFQEKLETQLCLNNNAFALILRDENGYPMEMYPIIAASVEAIYDAQMNLYLRFYLHNGKIATFPYADVIHLRNDFGENDIFGDSPAKALAPLMEIVGTTDQGIVKAIRNSGVIRWLLKFTNTLRPEDLKKQARDFAENFLSATEGTGVAATDAKGEAVQITPNDYVPNAAQMDRTTNRLYSFFNTNENIVQSKYTENEWISYFESQVEPDARQWSEEQTRKLFSRRERGFGNKIYYEAGSLQYATLSTKLALQAMVDRGAMTPNEWREAFNLAPIPGGDNPIRRLDTAPVAGGDKNEN